MTIVLSQTSCRMLAPRKVFPKAPPVVIRSSGKLRAVLGGVALQRVGKKGPRSNCLVSQLETHGVQTDNIFRLYLTLVLCRPGCGRQTGRGRGGGGRLARLLSAAGYASRGDGSAGIHQTEARCRFRESPS